MKIVRRTFMNWESYSHPISDVRDWKKNNRLELQPDFQRNVVWSKSAQIMLIDTILHNIPIPKIYIKSIIKDGKTYRVVVDGQQRLTAILRFVNNDLKLAKPYSGEYEGCKFNDLPPEVQNSILRYKIDINEIFNPDECEIRDLYARVNKYTVQLNRQELRKADFPGDLITISSELSELDFFTDGKIFTVKQRRRMLDVEYVLELLAIILEGIQDKKNSLDELCEKYQSIEDNGNNLKIQFTNIIDDLISIFNRDEFPIESTRFKQKSDFYTLFSSIRTLHAEECVLNQSCISSLRKKLKTLSDNVMPYSEDEVYREYAMHCLGDANSITSRKWREAYILDYLRTAYIKHEV